MADANAVIRILGQQLAQLTVDKAILEAEVTELRSQLGGAGTSEVGAAGEAPA